MTQEARDGFVMIRVSSAERKALDAVAAKTGQNLSEVLRSLVLKERARLQRREARARANP